MTRSMAHRGWFRVLVIGLMLILGFGGIHAASQVTSPEPSRAQVIAQGGQQIDRGPMQWLIDFPMVESVVDGAATSFAGGFVYAVDQPVVVARANGDTNLLSLGQGMYAPPTAEHYIYSTTEVDSGLLTARLVPGRAGEAFAVSTPFRLDPGMYNLQLTSGLMVAGETDAFVPVNDGNYMFLLAEGEVEISTVGTTEVYVVEAGEVMELTGQIEITATSPGPIRYLIIAVGDLIPNVPDRNGNGDVTLYYYNCDPTSFVARDVDACEHLYYPFNGTLTRDIHGETVTLTTVDDADATNDGGWIFTDVPAGDWAFSLDDEAAIEGTVVAVVGSSHEVNGEQFVTVEAGKQVEAHILISYPDEQASLTMTFMSCPQFWNEEDGVSECTMFANIPDLVLEDVTDDTNFYTTYQDGVMIEPGVYEFHGMAPGTYRLDVTYNDDWTFYNTDMGWDAWYESGEWYVEIVPDVPTAVIVVRLVDSGGVMPTPPSELGTGTVVVEQLQCSSDAELACVPAEASWEVYFTESERGEVYILTIDGEYRGGGIWTIILPEGGYWVDPADNGWYIEFSPWVDVFPGQESYVQVRGYTP